MTPEFTALGAHIYAAGFTCGMSRHLRVLDQWEEGDWGSNTTRLNFPHFKNPLTREEWPIDEYRNRVNVLYTNPPCAPWSMAGARLGVNDPRLEFTKNCFWLAHELDVQIFIVESVPQAWAKGKYFYERLAEDLRAAGFATTVVFTNALLHGAPQSRSRFHMIAHKVAIPFEPPYFDPRQIKTSWDVIGPWAKTAKLLEDLQEGDDPNHVFAPLKPAALEVIKRLKPGDGWNVGAKILEDEGTCEKVPRGRFVSYRLRPDLPVGTILDIGVMVHPTEDRMLTLREGALLCGYPADYKFAVTEKNAHVGGRTADVTQAVIPPVGEFWGELFARALRSGKPANQEDRVRVYDWRKLAKPWGPRLYKQSMENIDNIMLEQDSLL